MTSRKQHKQLTRLPATPIFQSRFKWFCWFFNSLIQTTHEDSPEFVRNPPKWFWPSIPVPSSVLPHFGKKISATLQFITQARYIVTQVNNARKCQLIWVGGGYKTWIAAAIEPMMSVPLMWKRCSDYLGNMSRAGSDRWGGREMWWKAHVHAAITTMNENNKRRNSATSRDDWRAQHQLQKRH